LLAVPTLADVVQQVDDLVTDGVVAVEQDQLVSVARFLAVVGGTAVSAVVVLVVALLLVWQRRWPGLAVWLVAVAISELLNAAIKDIYERARPSVGLVEESSFSFVSGHSMTAAVLAITLVLVYVPAGPRRRVWLVVAVGYALLMASGRVYLRAHWLSDTLAGVTLGAACALSVALVASWWYARRPGPGVSLGRDVPPLEQVHAGHDGHNGQDQQPPSRGQIDPVAHGIGADEVVPR
jgi:membrane-associated phospholipid phosphatase